MLTIFRMLLFDNHGAMSSFLGFALLFQYGLCELSMILLPTREADQVLDQQRKLIQHVENGLFALLANH